MFNWLRRWQRNRRREIFRYWDGRKNRVADPIRVWREIIADPEFEIERDAGLMEVNDREAWVRCVNATRRILGIPEFEQGGLTEDETVQQFQAFCVFVATLKKNSSPPQITPPPTAPFPPSSTTDTPQSSDSISISDGPSFDPPVMLRTG